MIDAQSVHNLRLGTKQLTPGANQVHNANIARIVSRSGGLSRSGFFVRVA